MSVDHAMVSNKALPAIPVQSVKLYQTQPTNSVGIAYITVTSRHGEKEQQAEETAKKEAASVGANGVLCEYSQTVEGFATTFRGYRAFSTQ